MTTPKCILEGEPSLDYDGLKILAQELDRPVGTLIALGSSNDPFYITPARQAKVEWFADLWDRFLSGKGVHVRRLHYKIVSQDPPILKADGKPYENTEADWQDLCGIVRDARYAGLVPADHFVDRRAAEPLIKLDAEYDVDCSVTVEGQDSVKVVGRAMPPPPALSYEFIPPQIGQRYHVELWCEKTTVNDVLERLAERYHLNVITGSGELSVTACLNVTERALASGRPVRVLYVSDFDPGGMSMPLAMARKTEFMLYQRELKDKLDIQVRAVVLTHELCERYRLPRTPLKETERRAAKFEERHGEGGTELDALEALHPGELERILEREILRYYDDSLDYKVEQAAEQAEAELASEIERVNQEVLEEHRDDLDRLRAQWAKIAKEIAAFERASKPVWRAITKSLTANKPDEPEVDWPEPDEGDEDDDPMFDSTREYVEQIDRYKEHQGKTTEWNRVEAICANPRCDKPGGRFIARRSNAKVCSSKCQKAIYYAAKKEGAK